MNNKIYFLWFIKHDMKVANGRNITEKIAQSAKWLEKT